MTQACFGRVGTQPLVVLREGHRHIALLDVVVPELLIFSGRHFRQVRHEVFIDRRSCSLAVENLLVVPGIPADLVFIR